MQKKRSNNRGFTLIEVIFTLVLVGATATLAGMWIVNVANGYVFAKTNADTVQKAQLAMTRLTKEFQAIQSVNTTTGATTATRITYTRAQASSSVGLNATVSQSGSVLLLDADILTDGVSGFTLNYCNDTLPTPACSSTWTSASRLIQVTLMLSGAGNPQSRTFTQRIVPRNL